MPATEVRKEVLVSIDAEFTGSIPGLYSMISLGAVAYDQTGTEISRFKVNLKKLPGTDYDDIRKAWWAKHPEAWAAAKKDAVKPKAGMKQFAQWLTRLPGSPKLIGWPLPVDFMFVNWYYMRFVDGSKLPPFGYDGIDIKSYAMRTLGLQTLAEVSRTKAREMVGVRIRKFSHDALADAVDQAELFFALRKFTAKP